MAKAYYSTIIDAPVDSFELASGAHCARQVFERAFDALKAYVAR